MGCAKAIPVGKLIAWSVYNKVLAEKEVGYVSQSDLVLMGNWMSFPPEDNFFNNLNICKGKTLAEDA